MKRPNSRSRGLALEPLAPKVKVNTLGPEMPDADPALWLWETVEPGSRTRLITGSTPRAPLFLCCRPGGAHPSPPNLYRADQLPEVVGEPMILLRIHGDL